MQPHKLTVNDVFEKERRYVIPLYQRAYVWNREDQWEPLWDDIRRSAEECSADDAESDVKTHFLGAVVWSLSKIVGKAVPRADVIDGQQRLTTLQICLAAFRDYAREISADAVRIAERWTVNPILDKSSDEVFKVWPSNADRATFRKVMSARSKEALLAHYATLRDDNGTLPRMVEAYLFFDQAIREFAGTSEREIQAARLDAIAQSMRAALQFVVIELEQGDDPQVIFETLNARGQPLLPSDLIRNFVFLQAANLGPNKSDQLYDAYWRPFDDRREPSLDEQGEDRFWHKLERQGRLTRPRIDLFMFHYLTMHTEQELNIGQLFREFRDWRARQTTSIDALLVDLQEHSHHFAQLIDPTGDNRLATLARRLHSLDTSTVYPLLLYLASLPTKTLSTVERDQAIGDIESFLVRRFICWLTTKNYNKVFLSVLIKAKRAAVEGRSVEQTIRDELLRSAEPTALWPGDDDFERAWKTKPIYVKSRADRAAMVLRALEINLRKAKNEANALPNNLTVEHLLPQKGALADYPYSPTLPLQNDETPERCRTRMIHTIGNLTLLTHALNASISNGPFAAKRTEIAENSDLRLNAWMRNSSPTAWSESEILARSQTLFARAVQIWPKPPASA
jgi:uncharacterized protein with ParB-like and HNH nuclease domain